MTLATLSVSPRKKQPTSPAPCLQEKRVWKKRTRRVLATEKDQKRNIARAWISLTSLFSPHPPSTLEGVVQDVNSHEKFVFLNVVDVHFAGYNLFPRRETQDRMQPLVFR